MKPAFVSLLALCLCLSAIGAEKIPTPKEIADTKAKAEQGDAIAQINLGTMCRDGKGVKQDYKKAFEWFTKAAGQGHSYAQSGLGHLYLMGWGVPKDCKQAFEWSSKAATDKSNPFGSLQLGSLYRDGLGVDRDYKMAYAWYTIAAANGNAFAKKEKANISVKMTVDQTVKARELSNELLKEIEDNKKAKKN